MEADRERVKDAEDGSRAPKKGGRLAAILISAWILAAVVAWALRETGGRPAPPVCVLIVWDSVDRERLSVYGYERETSPALADLAAEGIVFEEHMPSVDSTTAGAASLLTGLRARHHLLDGISEFGRRGLGASIPTLAQRFQAAGWLTLGAVSLPHLVGEESGLSRGFEQFEGPPAEPVRAVRSAAETIESVLPAFQRALSKGERVFLYLHLADVRAPELARQPGAGRFLVQRGGELSAKQPELAARLALAAERKSALEELVTEYARRRGDPVRALLERAVYDAAVARMDDALRRILYLLEESGRSSLVLVTGGPAGGEPFDAPREEGAAGPGLRAPLIMRLPDPSYIGRSRVPTQDVDLAPTLLGVAQLEPFEREDGVDLARAIYSGEAPAEGRVPFIESADGAISAGFENQPAGALAGARGRFRISTRELKGPVELELHETRNGLLRIDGNRGITSLGTARELVTVDETNPADFALGRSRGELEVRVLSSVGGLSPIEEQVFIGGRSIAELDLPLLLEEGAPWPRDLNNFPESAAVVVTERPGGWLQVQMPQRAEVVVEWLPANVQLDAGLLRAAPEFEILPHPRRAGACIVSGPAPFELEIRRRPGGRVAIACTVDGARVPQEQIRFVNLGGHSTRSRKPFEIAFVMTPGAWSDPALYTPVPEDGPPGLILELLDLPPQDPPDPPRDERERIRRKQLGSSD